MATETPVVSTINPPSVEDWTSAQETEELIIRLEDRRWPPRGVTMDEKDTSHHSARSACSVEQPVNEDRAFSKDRSSGTTNAGMNNFLGVGENTNTGADNFLGVGESAEAAVNFLGVGENSDSGRETFDGAVENGDADPDIDRFFQPEEDVYQDTDSALETGKNVFSDLDSLVGTGKNYYSDQDGFVGTGKSIYADLDGLIGAGKNAFSVSDALTGAEKNVHSDRNNFLGVGQGGDSSQGPEHFLGAAGTVAEKRPESVQDTEPWVEVKIEIDVADTEFVATGPPTQKKTNSSTSNKVSLPKNHQSHTQKDSLEPGPGENELTVGTRSSFECSDPKYKEGASEDKSQRAEASQSESFTNSDHAHSVGFPELVPWQIKVEPGSEDSSDGSSAVRVGGKAQGGRWPHHGSDKGAVISMWSSFLTQHNIVHEEMDQDSSLSSSAADSTIPAKVADPNVPDLSGDLHIKQEPVTLATDHVTHIVSGINMERLQTSGSVYSLDCPAEPSSEYNPDFVIKMEPESDQETVINGATDGSQDDSTSATEDEETYNARKQRDKITNSPIKKPQNRLVKPHPYHCQYCDSTFAKKSRLREHTRVHTDERPYSCDQCNISFRKAESLKVHIRTHTGELPFRCQDCECAFKCSQELKRHTIRKHLAIRPFSCPQCDARFFSKADLRGHSRLHTGEKPYKCTDCHAAFRKSSALTCHMRIHTGQKPYACTECDRTFRRSDQLKRHMKLHTGEKPYECNECDAAFTCMSDLKKHCARKHSLVKPFSCPECGNKFFTNEDLKMHRIFHMGIKPHSCSECGASFVRASDLKVHMRIHTGEKPFSCNICGATFARSGDLRLHLRMHEDKRPFTCTVCSLSFRRSGHLTRHMNTHNGQKSFSCEDCDAAFFTSSDLKRHASRVHKKDVSKFACTECEARFFTSRALNIHMMKHTGERPFPCGVCGAAFSHSDLLTAHMEVHDESEKQKSEAEPVTEASGQYMYIDVSMIATEPDTSSDSHRAEMPSVQMSLES